jgi:hypothetical protein
MTVLLEVYPCAHGEWIVEKIKIMNKELLKNLQLQAGGSHYPSINPEMQLAFARLIVKECIEAVRNTDTRHAYTTFDKGLIDTTVERSIKSIKERFDYNGI